jgi:hypothetical protein
VSSNLVAAWDSPRNLTSLPPSRLAGNNIFLCASKPSSAILGALDGAKCNLEPNFGIFLNFIWTIFAFAMGAL